MTQPARNSPREQRKNPTAQLSVFIALDVKERVKAAAEVRGEKLLDYVERALRAQLAAESTCTGCGERPPDVGHDRCLACRFKAEGDAAALADESPPASDFLSGRTGPRP